MQPFLTDEEMSALEKKKEPPAFLSDEEMTALAPKAKSATPEFLSDEEMNKLETVSEEKLPERFAGQTVTEDYLAKVAKQRGVPVEDLQGYVAFMGGYRPEIGPGDPGFWSDIAKEGAGMVEDIALSGIGKKLVTKVAKQFQSNPDAWEAAIDDIRQHVEAQKSTGRTIGEMVVGGLAGVGAPAAAGKGVSALTKGLKVLDAPTAKTAEFIGKNVERLAPTLSKGSQQVLTGATTGAAFGAAGALGQSRGDDDWSDTGTDILKGAGAGAAFGGALSGAVGGLTGQFKKAGKEGAESVATRTGEVASDIDPAKMELLKNEKTFAKLMEQNAKGEFNPSPESVLARMEKDGVTESIAKQRVFDDNLKAAIQKETKLEGDDLNLAAAEYKKLREGFSGYLKEGKLTDNKYSSDALKEAYYQRVGDGRIEEDFSDYLRLSKLEAAKASGTIKPKPPANEDWLSKGMSYISANTPRFAEVAGRLNLPVDVWKGQLSRGLNEAKRLSDKYSKDLETMYSTFRKQGLTTQRFGELAERMQGQDISKAAEILKPLNVSKNEIDTLTKVHELFNQAHKDATSKGFKGEKLKGLDPATQADNIFYAPQKMMALPDAIATLNSHMKKIEKSGIDWKNLDALPENPSQDLIDGLKGLEQITGKSFLKSTKDGLVLGNPKAYNEAVNSWNLGPKQLIGDYEASLVSKASAALRREEGIPKFLLEKDPIKLANEYVNDLFKFVETEPFINRLRYASNVAKAKGDTYSQNIIENTIKTLYSSKPATLAEGISSAGKAYEAKLKTVIKDPDVSEASKFWAERQLGAQDAMRWFGTQMYKNLLASPQSFINNLFQTSPFGMTAAEFGMARGTQIWLKAVTEFAADAARIKSRDPTMKAGVLNKVEAWKDLPFDQKRAHLEMMRQGIEDNGMIVNNLRKAGVSIDSFTDYAMTLWRGAELFNKYVGNAMGDEAAKMYLKNPRDSRLKFFLTNMSPGYKQELAKLGPAPNPARVSELMRNYLSDKTLFQYDRANMSDFAKDLNILGAFTRFPTEAIGDLRYTARRKDLNKWQKLDYLGSKYAGPITAAAIVNGLYFGLAQDKSFLEGVKGPGKQTDEDTYGTNMGRYLLRQQGFLAAPHLTSLMNLWDEGYEPPPSVAGPVAIGQAIAGLAGATIFKSEDKDTTAQKRKLMDSLTNVLATFTPGANIAVWANQAQRLSDLENKEAQMHPFKQMGRNLLDE